MKIFGLEIKRVAEQKDKEAYAKQVLRYLNANIPIPLIDSPTAYITQGYAYNPLVYAVISIRAAAAKAIPWIAYKVADQKKLRRYSQMQKKWNDPIGLLRSVELKEQALEEVEGTPVNNLLEKPNDVDTFQDIIEKFFIYRDTTGNSYLYVLSNEVTQKPIMIKHLPADKVRIVAGTPVDPIRGYTVQEYLDGILSPEKVVHWKYSNPVFSADGRWLYGMSPLRPAATIIAQENMAIQGQTAAFMNEGLKGVLTGTEQTIIDFTPQQAEAIRDNFKKQSGYKNKNNIAFNRAPLNFVKIGESPVDLGVQQARVYNKETLCNVFRIHPSLLSSDASTLNNMVEARKSLMTMSVLPDLESLKWHLNNRVISKFGPEYYIDFDIMAIPELQEDGKTLADTLKAMDWVTINEKREATAYDRYDNEAADRLYQPFGLGELGEDMDTGFNNIPE